MVSHVACSGWSLRRDGLQPTRSADDLACGLRPLSGPGTRRLLWNAEVLAEVAILSAARLGGDTGVSDPAIWVWYGSTPATSGARSSRNVTPTTKGKERLD
jgi:hypothetical protein